MTDRFRNRFRIPSTRASWWNYRDAGWYFITICTKPRLPFFGQIKDGRMMLNEIGVMAAAEWEKSFALRPDMNLSMGEYIIMPDHVHAIIGIGPNRYNIKPGPRNPMYHPVGQSAMDDADKSNPECETTKPPGLVDDPGRSSLSSVPGNQFGPQSKNLASIIRGYKASVTRNARLIRPDFNWLARYHDHIIRSEAEYKRIERYIINNPSK